MNRIEDIVPRTRWALAELDSPSRDGRAEAALLRELARLAGVAVECEAIAVEHPRDLVLSVRCRGRGETIRLGWTGDLFPPSVLVAYLNAKLGDAGSTERLVACRDATTEVIALCDPAQAAELRAAIFAIIDDLRWPPAVRAPIEDELRAAIRATPDDDGPRLVYADWLIERGDRRGDVIMLQCHADPAVRDRANPLLYVHHATWTSHLPAWARRPWFERGFVHRVTMELDTLLAHHAELFAVTPVPDLVLAGRGELAKLSPDGRLALHRIGPDGPDDETVFRDTEMVFRVIELATRRTLLQRQGLYATELGFTPDSRNVWFRTEVDETTVPIPA